MTIRVAVVGLGFGAEFLPIYQRHPDAELYAICQRSPDKLNEVGDQVGVERLSPFSLGATRKQPLGSPAFAPGHVGPIAHNSQQ